MERNYFRIFRGKPIIRDAFAPEPIHSNIAPWTVEFRNVSVSITHSIALGSCYCWCDSHGLADTGEIELRSEGHLSFSFVFFYAAGMKKRGDCPRFLTPELNEPSGDFFGFFQKVSVQALWVDLLKLRLVDLPKAS
jgi:hypothetical protein